MCQHTLAEEGVEHPSLILKRIFGFNKVCCRGSVHGGKTAVATHIGDVRLEFAVGPANEA